MRTLYVATTVGMIAVLAFLAINDFVTRQAGTVTLYVGCGIGLLLLGIPAAIKPTPPLRLLPLGICLLSLAILYAIPWPRQRVFVRRLERITIGMPADAVRTLMRGFPQGTGLAASPGATAGHAFLGTSPVCYPLRPDSNGQYQIPDALVYRVGNAGVNVR